MKRTTVLAERLPEAASDGFPEVKWIHVATEGKFGGHHQGGFHLDAIVFDRLIQNFRRDPRFKAGPDGVGAAKVVPFDYEHVSEMIPMADVAQGGAPAPAWVMDLQIRDGEDGKKQLWALAHFGEKVRGQIAAGEYRFVSIAFAQKATDPEEGNDIGPLLTSIAFTNQPFLKDLEPLAASARGAQLDLPGVHAIADLWIRGVEAGAKLASGQGAALQIPQAPGEKAGAPDQGARRMELSDLGKTIAAKAEKVQLKGGTRTILQDGDVEAVVDELVESTTELGSILEALGVPNGQDALAQIAALRDAQAKLSEMKTQLDEALAVTQVVEQEQEMIDIDAALSAKSFDKSAEPALKLHRKSLIESKGRDEGRKAFLGAYAVPEKEHAHLLTSLVAKPAHARAAAQAPQQAAAVPEPKLGDDANVINLTQFMGRNDFERLCRYVQSRPENKGKDWQEIVVIARTLRRNSGVAIKTA